MKEIFPDGVPYRECDRYCNSSCVQFDRMAFCLDEERNQAWRRFDHGAVVCAVCCVYLHEIDDQERWNI